MSHGIRYMSQISQFRMNSELSFIYKPEEQKTYPRSSPEIAPSVLETYFFWTTEIPVARSIEEKTIPVN